MGRPVMRRPKHLSIFRDRHGKVRIYLKRPGCGQVPLPGPLGSPEFLEAYAAAVASEPNKRPPKTAGEAGTFNRLLVEYLASPNFRGTKKSSQEVTRGILERFAAEHGHRRVNEMKKKHVILIMGEKADTPAAANNWLKKVRALMNFAVDSGYREDNPTFGIKRYKTGEIHTWTNEQLAQFEGRWPLGSVQYTAYALALYTGQRRSDVARMTWADISQNKISVVQDKTTEQLKIPLHSKLREALEAWPRRHVVILSTAYGKARTADGFGGFMADAIEAAGLPAECVLHGLRKAAARKLAEAGCTTRQIMAITGHKSYSEIERYTKAAEQELSAEAAMGKWEEQMEAENFQTSSKKFPNRKYLKATSEA